MTGLGRDKRLLSGLSVTLNCLSVTALSGRGSAWKLDEVSTTPTQTMCMPGSCTVRPVKSETRPLRPLRPLKAQASPLMRSQRRELGQYANRGLPNLHTVHVVRGAPVIAVCSSPRLPLLLVPSLLLRTEPILPLMCDRAQPPASVYD